jgi:hypothetical protein
MKRALSIAVALAGAGISCTDVTSWSTRGDHFEGLVVQGGFVRTGFGGDVTMCMTFDGAHVQDAPGMIATNDGRFHAAPLRPIPQVWHDAFSTMSFGEGRVRNLPYAVQPVKDEPDAMAIVSLMKDDAIEVRIVRGAPGRDGGTVEAPLFAIFRLERHPGPCAF